MNRILHSISPKSLFSFIWICLGLVPVQAIPWSFPHTDTLLYLPEGTRIVIQTEDFLSTSSSYFGKAFEAILVEPIRASGRIVLPEGTPVNGVVKVSERARNIGGRAYIALELEEIAYEDVWIPIQTDRLGFTGNSSDTGLKAGVGAGVGAVVGGFKWAVRGALVGLGVAALTPGKQIYLPQGTELEFYLDSAVVLVSERL